MKRIGLVSLFDDRYAEIGTLSADNKFEYCRRRGYSFHVVRHLLVDPPATFSKLPLLERLLPLHDWLMWIDTDALIMNFDVEVERYLDERYSLIIGEDWNGVNAGVFFLRNTEWSLEFLRRAQSVPRQSLTRFRDQEQLTRALETGAGVAENVDLRQLKQVGGDQDFNCYPPDDDTFPQEPPFRYFEEGDFVVHFAGLGGSHDPDRRNFLPEILREYATRVIK